MVCPLLLTGKLILSSVRRHFIEPHGKIRWKTREILAATCQYLTCLCLTIAFSCSEKPLSLSTFTNFPLKPQLRNAMMPWCHVRTSVLALSCFCTWLIGGIASVKSDTDVLLLQEIMIYMSWLHYDTSPFILIVHWNKFLKSIWGQRDECGMCMTHEYLMDMDGHCKDVCCLLNYHGI